MAEFCAQCAAELHGKRIKSGFIGLCKEGEVVSVLCEGCGPVYVDHRGVCQHHGRGTSEDCRQQMQLPLETIADATGYSQDD